MEIKAKELVELLISKNLKISAAESCTGGLFTKLITDIAGSSAVLDASVVTYANSAKVSFLGVSQADIDKYGVVSKAIACQMAEGIARLTNSDIGVGITGIAGPGGGSENKPVGLVWTAVCYGGKTLPCELKLSGKREEIRLETCKKVMDNIMAVIA